MPGPLPPTTRSNRPQPGQHKVLGSFTATAYCHKFGVGSINGTGVTAGGTDLRDGVQRYVIAAGLGSGLKMGDIVSIEPNPFGPGTAFKVDDHGGAIFGHHIDIYVADCQKANAWGHRQVAVNLLPSSSGTGTAPGDKVLTGVSDTVAGAVGAVVSPITSVAGFMSKLGVIFKANFWLRVLMVLGGLSLIGFGVVMIAKQYAISSTFSGVLRKAGAK